jgi:hypothetical protein
MDERPKPANRRSGASAKVPLIALIGLALGAGLWASAAAGQDKAPANQPATAVPGVTVPAPQRPQASPAPTPEIRNFVRSRGATARIGQLARWRDDICPQTLGLPPAFNAFVSKRVQDVAAAVGAPVKPGARCTTNVAIIFTPRPQQLLDDIRQKHTVLLGFHYPAQLKRIATFNHPIQAWYVTATQGSGGNVAVPGSGGGLVLDDSCCPEPGGTAGSKFSVGLNSQIEIAMVVADANKVADHDIGAIADYVALLALAQTKPADGCGPLPSITDLLASNCGAGPRPNAITDADIAYLKALYDINLGTVLWAEQSSIADRMQQAVKPK